MDLVYALVLALGARHDTPLPTRPPLTLQPGTLQSLPDPLPYVLESRDWGR